MTIGNLVRGSKLLCETSLVSITLIVGTIIILIICVDLVKPAFCHFFQARNLYHNEFVLNYRWSLTFQYINVINITFRVTKWTTSSPHTSVLCWPQWINNEHYGDRSQTLKPNRRSYLHAQKLVRNWNERKNVMVKVHTMCTHVCEFPSIESHWFVMVSRLRLLIQIKFKISNKNSDTWW